MSFGIPGQGINPTAYTDRRLRTVPAIKLSRDPTFTDNTFPLMTVALNDDTLDVFILADYLPINQAQWIKLTGGTGDLDTLTPDVGGSVSAVGADIDILGQDTPSQNGMETFNIAAGQMGVRMKSPFTIEDFTYTTATASTTRSVTVSNTDATSLTSNAALRILSESGGGDSFIDFTSGGTSIVLGVDNDAGGIRFTTGATPSLGNFLWSLGASGGIINQSFLDGSQSLYRYQNMFNTAGSALLLEVVVSGSSADDPYFRCRVDGVDNWAFGLDNDDDDKFVISKSSALGSNNALEIETVGSNVTFPSTGYTHIATGTTGEQPTPIFGMIRGNSTLSVVEGWDGSDWIDMFGGGGGGPTPPKEYWFGAESLQPLETLFAPLEKLTGTFQTVFIRAYDDTVEEFANSKLQVPSDLDVQVGAEIKFKCYVMSKVVAASRNIGLTFGHKAVSAGENFDQAFTDVDSTAVAINSTQDFLTLVTWTETVANLGWTADELVEFRLSRDNSVATNLVGDLYIFSLVVEIPRA